MFILASIIHLGKSGLPKTPITEDDLDRLALCLKLIAEKVVTISIAALGLQKEEMRCMQVPIGKEIFLTRCRESLETMLEAHKNEKEEAEQRARGDVKARVQVTALHGSL